MKLQFTECIGLEY